LETRQFNAIFLIISELGKDRLAGPFALLCVVLVPGSPLKPLKGTIQPDFSCRKVVRYRWIGPGSNREQLSFLELNFSLKDMFGHWIYLSPCEKSIS
jgi:hypothetical protein